jgi:hypothetical protein
MPGWGCTVISGILDAMKKLPIPVLIVVAIYLLVGVAGFIFHFRELTAGHPDAIGIELTELLAVVSGVGLWFRQNWARWLALAWVVFHVGLSLFHPLPELMIHAALCAVIAWLLFRPGTAAWFKQSEDKS